jgi:hypothetical protein
MEQSSQPSTLRYLYSFQFEDGTARDFEILLDGTTLELRSSFNPSNPEWTKLKYHQCGTCPLGDEVEYCPVAVNIATLIESFKMNQSTEEAFVLVDAPDRSYAKQTTMQKGISSIMGIYMVTSNCPILDKLRPMVRFHLPFASATETVFRSVSSYLLAQYFVHKSGGEPDWDLKNIVETYKDVAKVNKGLWNRFSAASKLDANVNALIILNSFGDALRHSIKSGLNDLKPLFADQIKASTK